MKIREIKPEIKKLVDENDGYCPCAVFKTPCPEMYEYKADYICFYNKYPDSETNNICVSIDSVDYSFDDFGRVVFTNKEDAIKAIKENNNGH